MDRGYWSIDSILADSQKLPCTLNLDVRGLGYLQGNSEPDIQQHTRVELPFWIAELLALHELVTIAQPRQFGPRIRAALDADARSVHLRGQNAHWYALGARLADLTDSTDLLHVLSKTYTSRLAQIFKQAQHLSASSSSSSSANTSRSSGGRPDMAMGMAMGLGSGFGSGNAATTIMSAEMVEFVQGLDETEKLLLKTGHDAAKTMKDYLAGNR